MDDRILQLIDDSRFERSLYEAAVFNLEDRRNKLRFHNFAFAMRELAGHTLARLAPDEDVKRCIWWKKKPKGTVPQVTRIERCVYATQGGLSNHYVVKKLGLDFSRDYETLRDAVIRLSEYVHITPEVFELSDEDIDRLAQETVDAVGRLMGCIDECRKAIADRLSESITDAAIQQVLGESLDAVDELATHYYVEDVEVDSHDVTGITADAVHIRASGSIGVTLQWGSNSDLRNGDGAEMDQSFGFTCELTCATPNPDPDTLEYVENSVMVDTGDWHSGADDWDDVVSGEDTDDRPSPTDVVHPDF
ncbi:hypothetical protein ABNM01_02390 [Pseudomonas syringae]